MRRALREGADVIGWPRLVRLNPNVPWKTRGNAALGVRLGRGSGRRWKIGEMPEGAVEAFERGSELEPRASDELEAALWETIRATSRTGEPGTDPAMVTSPRRLPATLYWKAVRQVVPVPTAREAIASVGGRVRTLDSGRGVVGAAAVLAWPARKATWELIAYRAPEREASRRRVDADSVRRTSARFPELFLCHDPRTRRVLVAPHTPCPILFGLRARRPERLERARVGIRSEPVERWMIFATNQGSGDHLGDLSGRELQSYGSGRLTGVVRSTPETGPGGHVRFDLEEPDGFRTACLVFEPTKTLPKIARHLAEGDSVRVWGGRGVDPVFRVEGIEVRSLSPRWSSPTPPRCPDCRRPAASVGAGRGYRCPECRRRFPPESAGVRRLRPTLAPGVYHPTPSARRHLHPLAPEA
ncbi:MAG: tRNA(Ile)(2)-agmatinylcytidine synthase [Thermoplasmata archaeon]|nr:tRNA(Ile)(2)-agmatinylcytidine synthase [Thermoplasmata archaeon]